MIRTLRKLGYLESDIDATVDTGYDPLVDDEPELARTMATSVQQRIAFGERAGEKVRRIDSGFGHDGESPTLSGTRCAIIVRILRHLKRATDLRPWLRCAWSKRVSPGPLPQPALSERDGV